MRRSAAINTRSETRADKRIRDVEPGHRSYIDINTVSCYIFKQFSTRAHAQSLSLTANPLRAFFSWCVAQKKSAMNLWKQSFRNSKQMQSQYFRPRIFFQLVLADFCELQAMNKKIVKHLTSARDSVHALLWRMAYKYSNKNNVPQCDEALP